MSLEKSPYSFLLNLNPHPSSSSSIDITEMIKLSDISGSYMYSQPTPTYSTARGINTQVFQLHSFLGLDPSTTFNIVSNHIKSPRLNENKEESFLLVSKGCGWQ